MRISTGNSNRPAVGAPAKNLAGPGRIPHNSRLPLAARIDAGARRVTFTPLPPAMPRLSRRRFLQGSLLAGAAASLVPAVARRGGLVLGIEPFRRPGKPAFPLGLAAYSFRQYFGFMRGKPQEPAGGGDPMTMIDFIDYCADHRCAAELTSYFFPPDVTEDYLLGLKRHAFLRGVPISGTAVGNNFALPEGEARAREIAYVKEWIDHAAVMGAPHIRVFAGASNEIPKDKSIELCVSALQECCDYAGRRGVFLGLENHGGIVAEADDLIAITRAVDSPWFGINLDTGNFNTADPYADLARCAPFAVNVQVKVEIRPAGKDKEDADLDRIASILRGAAYQGYVTLEYEAPASPHENVPRHLERLRKSLGQV